MSTTDLALAMVVLTLTLSIRCEAVVVAGRPVAFSAVVTAAGRTLAEGLVVAPDAVVDLATSRARDAAAIVVDGEVV